jgi:hypothetical protein
VNLVIPGEELPITVAEAFTATPVSLPAKRKILEDARLGRISESSPVSGADIAQVVDGMLQLRKAWAAPTSNTFVEALRSGVGRRRLVVYPTILDSSGSYVPSTRRARSQQEKTRDYELPGASPSTVWVHVGYVDRGAGVPTLIDITADVVAGNSTVSSAVEVSPGVIQVKLLPGSGDLGVVLRLRAVDDLKFTDPRSGGAWDLDAAKPRLDQQIYIEF